jgi:hypothetical protein
MAAINITSSVAFSLSMSELIDYEYTRHSLHIHCRAGCFGDRNHFVSKVRKPQYMPIGAFSQ